ncbi:hypothetical protein G7066_10595 [Leucobacter coleopterorum]|uniref:Uncharacterized protein n=1 Tax=Leucobacter coleopterorum TaxID=2714933 RepID=A0ABX6JX88_9MICO|nr:hypothetical protein [Leucobacter coleopterorum]QIM18924.1 hypothetical protein G7066_10595 [Leucobacter coleopterorum]
MKSIARRLAEQFTEVSLDERHAEARKRCRVSVREHDDGMADLIAHLPAAEAYAIYDRLTRMSRALEGLALLLRRYRSMHQRRDREMNFVPTFWLI